ncbi:hypothetical protein ACIOUE_00720 [Streptomyces xanthochromogenes]|uniref:hypothetical protein n=1 Tax=Streptomyces xanthochromogenes TaxID=67384 RepID=UPI00382849EA
MPDVKLHPTDGPVHLWFSLSYSNYQVLHRTLMQSMPIEWQERMVACLEELREAFWHVEQPEAFRVEAAKERIVRELTDAELAEAGIEADWYAGETPPEELSEVELNEWRAQYEQAAPEFYRIGDGEELDPHTRVLLPVPDQVPYYNRGRTYIEPRLAKAGDRDDD